MTIRTALLAGASLCTICAGAAFAKSTPVLVAQIHGGQGVVKTSMHSNAPANLTSSISVATGVSTSADFKKKTNLAATFYTFLHSGTFCNPPKQKVKLSTKKTKYAKLSTGVESYSEGCGTPSQFFGDVYDLTSKKGKNKTDKFTSALIGKDVHFGGTTYKKGTLNLKVSVAIGS
jgi:hypothetical protein